MNTTFIMGDKMSQREYRELIGRAWYDYFELNKDDVSDVRDLIKESWQRSRNNCVDFVNQCINENDEIHRMLSIRKNHLFIDIAKPYINDLYKIISDTDFMITLLDNEGYVIDKLIHPALLESSSFKIVNLKEERIGTNAMGTCLYLDQPVLTIGEEHCYKALHRFTTSAAPIHDNDGLLIGCIGITGFADAASAHTLGMATAAAYAIENKLKLTMNKNNNISQFYDSIMKHSISDIFITIDNHRKITSMNKTAENLLSIKEDEVLHKDISSVLGGSFDIGKYLNSKADVFNKRTVINIGKSSINCNISIIELANDLNSLGFIIIINNLDTRRDVVLSSNSKKLCSFEDIVGSSELMAEAKDIAKIASYGNSNILILGESGTGKELFAQSIHNSSPRKNKPFIDINCGALPLSLAESELFGYEGGSYTGSKKGGQPGKFELADGGTIFLDEIGELPLSIQVSLLRVIQERKVSRIGSTSSKDIDVMIIAATNKDLNKAVKDNTFRADLFYRLNVFTVSLPPLRDHKEDIPMLVDLFIDRYNQMFNTSISGMSSDAMSIFTSYNWPGNIRELENTIQRAVQVSKNNTIQVRDLPLYLLEHIDCDPVSPGISGKLMETQEHRTIINTLESTNGNIKLAAEILGVSRSTLYRKLSRLDFDINDFR